MAQTLSPDAIRSLSDSVENGRLQIPCSIDLSVDELTPLAGEPVTLQWSAETGDDTLELWINGDRVEDDMAPEGRRTLPTQDQVMTVEIRGLGASNTVVVSPRILRARVDEFVYEGSPGANEPIEIRWRTQQSEQCELRIIGPEVFEPRILQDSSGQLRLAGLEAGDWRFELHASNRHIRFTEDAGASAAFELSLRHRRPIIEQFQLREGHITLGQPIEISWLTRHAEVVSMNLGGEQAVGGQGSLSYRPENTGTETITLTATGPGGSAEKTVEVRVNAPPVECELRLSSDRVLQGETVAIQWQSSGGNRARLKLPDGRELETTLSGRLQFPVFHEGRVALKVRGLDGRWHSRRARISIGQPTIPAIHGELADLEGIGRGWLERIGGLAQRIVGR